MGRTVQTARKSTGGKAPRRQLATSACVYKGKGAATGSDDSRKADKPVYGKVKGVGKGWGKGGKGCFYGRRGGSMKRSFGEEDEDSSDEEPKRVKRNLDDGNIFSQETSISDTEKNKIVDSFKTGGRNVEVVFSFDTTGSMSSCLHEVRCNLRGLMKRLLRDIPNIRIGVLAHGDYCDNRNYVVREQELTSVVESLIKFVEDVPSTGGGDLPECYEWMLRKARHMNWTEDSAKALVIIGDALPHEKSYTNQHVEWQEELDHLVDLGVKVYGVRACNITQAIPFYQELAERSGGAYVEFKNFGIITDMFLAVCYREADTGTEDDGGQLEAFAQEIQAEGRMTDEVQNMMKQIKEAPREAKETKRYVSAPWWDSKLDNMKKEPLYGYIEKLDEWSPYDPKIHNNKKTASKGATTASSSKPASKRGRKAKGKGKR